MLSSCILDLELLEQEHGIRNFDEEALVNTQATPRKGLSISHGQDQGAPQLRSRFFNS